MSNFELVKLNPEGEAKIDLLSRQFTTLYAIVESLITTNTERKAVLAKMQEAFVIACRGLSYQKAYQVDNA